MRQDELQKFTEEMQAYVADNLPLDQLDDEQLEAQIEDLVMDGLADKRATIDQKVMIVREIYSSVRGFDILDSVMQDENVTRIMINSPANIFIERGGCLTKLDRTFDDPDKLEQIIRRMVSMGSPAPDANDPVPHVRLPDGTHVSAVLPPVASDGPSALICKDRKSFLTMQQLIRNGFITEEAAHKLQALVRAKYNILICGGAGAGKTTLLNALAESIPSCERIAAVEETAQLCLPESDNAVRLEAGGAVTVGDLIRAGLRMRPDRIVVDEIRGADAADLLYVLNAGFDGSIAVFRSLSVRSMLGRLESAAASGMPGASSKAVCRQIVSAVDVIVNVTAMRGRIGKVTEITEIAGSNNEKLLLNPLYSFCADENDAPETLSGTLKRTREPLLNDQKWRQSGLTDTF